MINTANLCMSCMKDIGLQKQCPYCGYHSDSPQIAPYLPIRTVIGNRYLVGKVIDFNGDGATYMGWDMNRRNAVTIREFLPDSISSRQPKGFELIVMPGCEITFRDCYQSFLELWRKLMRLNGLSALISVIDIIEDFGTAYAVSEYMECTTLREYLLSSKTGYIPWERARQIFMPVLSTIGSLHTSGIIHRGISPTTLLIGSDGKIRITGFSILQARTSQGDLTSQLFPGYSAIEQYNFDGKQGTWTDIYAFGAVLYRSLIGSEPLDAPSRLTNDRLMIPGKFAEQLPAYVINGLVNSLQVLPEDRTHTVEQLRAELSAAPSVALSGSAIPASTPPDKTEKIIDNEKKVAEKTTERKKTNMLIAKISMIVIAAGLVLFVILSLTVFRDSFSFLSNRSDTTTTVETNDRNSETVIVPDFVGEQYTYTAIKSNEVFAQNFVFTYEEQFSDTRPEDSIISQSVKAKSEVKKGSTIHLVVSKGKTKIIIPKLVNKTYADAEKELKALGLKCEKTIIENTDPLLNGIVISSNPTANEVCGKGSTVYLKVYADAVVESTDTDTTAGSDETLTNNPTDTTTEKPWYQFN